MYKEVIAELEGYLKTIQSFEKDSAQDGQACHAYLVELTQMMARSNYLMAEFQMKFRQEKKAAYIKLSVSTYSKETYYAPSLARDYIDAQCSETGFVVDLATRTSATCVHTADAMRTIISSLKSERVFAQYNS